MTNKQTYTTPCGTTYHVGQVLNNYRETAPLLDSFIGSNWSHLHWGANRYGEPLGYAPLPKSFPITITDLPQQPEPEEEWEEVEVLFACGKPGTAKFILNFSRITVSVKPPWCRAEKFIPLAHLLGNVELLRNSL